MQFYIDTFFFMNLAADYLILLATARLRALSVHRLRIFLGAAGGSIYALLSLFFPESLENPLLIAAITALMLLLVFGGTKGLMRTSLVFLAVACAFGGLGTALSSLLGGLRLDLGILLLLFPCCWLLLRLAFGARAAEQVKTCRVEIINKGRRVGCMALQDSGNLLKDPVSGDAVLILGTALLEELFGRESARVLCQTGDVSAFLELTKDLASFRLIPFGSIGGSGLLPAFRPEKLYVNGKERNDLLVAFTSQQISESDSFSAIIGGVQ